MHARQIAKASGAKRYIGKPCPHGHSGERLTVSGACVECHRENVAAFPPKGPRDRDPIKMRTYRRKWWDENPWFMRETEAARRERTPQWAERTDMQLFYAACQPGFEVDHVVPLKGRLVSGLHVLANLQYLPMLVNRKKSNRYAAQ